MLKHTVEGSKYRVQIRVIDLTSDNVPIGIRSQRPLFCVYALDACYNKSTAFTVAGTQIYYGDDPDLACSAADKYVEAFILKLPKSFCEYLTLWRK